MPFNVVLFLLFVGGIALIGVALSGVGSRDRSAAPPPRLPGHDIQDELRRRDES
ncbi:hypothetical protein [Aeromicrobium sp. P5_D10]